MPGIVYNSVVSSDRALTVLARIPPNGRVSYKKTVDSTEKDDIL